MKNFLTGLIIGILAVAIVLFLFFYKASPSTLFMEDESKYTFEETVAMIETEAKTKNWKIPVVHDLQKSMVGAGYEVNKVKVFALCNPEYAVKILENDEDRIVSSMLPCRIAVYEKSDGKTYISRMNTGLMAKKLNKTVADVMTEATNDVEEILKDLIK